MNLDQMQASGRAFEQIVARLLNLNTSQVVQGSIRPDVGVGREAVEWRCYISVPIGSLHSAFREAARRAGTTGQSVPTDTALEVLTENHQLDTRHAVPFSFEARSDFDVESIEWACRTSVAPGFLAAVEAEVAALAATDTR
ncbi:hypothetical protein G7075_04355 [Phycicoccus sp. HDW14]|uniref:hypothetical protein n=1 Tax=Phycicoccus sp. HDW14 TaxID=2714941 RepID=UPI00140D7CFD|nr:hypothetical protein [Phycicoccus sp. HDW14]QIM20550.1 hypothetical protein G7075_04355 [Phycicoccus sp. HDW14]